VYTLKTFTEGEKMKYLSRIFLYYIFITTTAFAQSLWIINYGYNTSYDRFVENLSIDSLRNIITLDSWEQPNALVYKAAVEKLYYFHKETEADFLLNNLNTEIDSVTTPLWAIDLEWDKFFTDAYTLGMLGAPVAIEKMRVIANDEKSYNRLYAIGHLAEAGVYDYYDFLKSLYYGGNEDPFLLFLFGLYSRNATYREEIKDILQNEVYEESDFSSVIIKANYLSWIPGADIQILNEFFRNSTGKERYNYFRHLDIDDKDGQVERSIFALQNETNDTFRVEYLPSPDIVISWNSISKRYLEPKFVNFSKGLNVTDPNSMTYKMKEFFLLAFVPVPPDSAKPTLDLLDNLNNYVDSVSIYYWLGDQQFKDELQSIIQSAKSELQAGDSVACAVQVKSFQDLVDNVYKDSLNTDPRFVTIEGWKFLYWNAQYILDRLPTPPFVTEQELNEITPAMSMKNNPGAFTMELMGSGFSSSSIVYFNGNVRATTFVSDSILNAAILAADVSAAGNFPLWVSDGTTNSDTLMFSVVENLPNEILPIMNCVTNNGDGTYTAYFGYNNKNSVSIFIPIYAQNKISPDPWDRGQPGVFKAGIWERVFSVTWTSGNIIWHLNNNIATAKKTSPPCP
jgi:hypothetical protein